MSVQEDVLARELAIAATLDKNGVAIKIKSRTVAAFDRLLGSLVDIPVAFSDGVARKKRVRDQIQERLLLAQADLAEQRLRGAPIVGDALLFDILKDAARKQMNAAGVAIEAFYTLKALPPPDTDATPEGESESESRPQHIDDDWMNQFVRYAEDASSDELQVIWGRVLAGEIGAPASFSRHTLRFIAELDWETAKNCEFVREHAVGDIVPMTELWRGGEGYLIGIDLQRLGLVEGIGSLPPAHSFEIGADGFSVVVAGKKALILYGPPGHKISIPAIVLTRLGREVFSLLEPQDSETGLREFAEAVRNSGVIKADIAKIMLQRGNTIQFLVSEHLWDGVV